jgi:predicted secreted acid phosphatase
MTLGLSLVFSPSLYSEPPNLALVKKELIHYHDSGLYQQELAEKIQQARQYIIQEALSNAQQKDQQKLALVLDIDETSLSNYDKMVKHDFTGTRAEIHKEILGADSPAIKPMLALYKDAINHGIKVFFVTGRTESERTATEDNLVKAGYKNWAGLYLRSDKYSDPSIIPFKSKTRAMISQQGYTIIASIGDQYSDIRGGYAKKGFKLPNPYYYLP